MEDTNINIEEHVLLQPIQDIGLEKIVINIKVKDLLFIGRTLQKNYIGSETTLFIN